MNVLEARRIALAAQGFSRKPRGVRAVFDRVALIQVDSVNVLVRSQELPLWARLKAHDRNTLPKLCRARVLFEYWAHEASLLPAGLQPLLRWRMAEARDKAWGGVRAIARRDPGYVSAVREEVLRRDGIIARDLPHGQEKKSGSWWGWDDRKRALAYLFWAGEITAIRSPSTFERVYLPWERVVPPEVLSAPTPSRADAFRSLLLISARALGVATARDLADYFRLPLREVQPIVSGLFPAVRVEGWREPAYLSPEAPRPRPVSARTVVSPFDSLIWDRKRTERLFGFHYRISIYTPAHLRKHGYYVLPFLLGESLVARVDLKADRAASALLVHGAFSEAHAPPETAAELAAELRALAQWLRLERVKVGRRGDLAAALRGSLR